jgi:hypothetical protein
MVVFGDHRVAELLVEAEIAGKLAADADTDFGISFGAGITVDPVHQRPPDPLALSGGIDGNAPHMKGLSLAIEPEAANGLPAE